MDNENSLTALAEHQGNGAAQYSPLSLAYLGDAVFELCVRSKLLAEGNAPANRLHSAAKEYVSAVAQSEMYQKIKEVLTEDELAVMKRGRNAKSFSKAKNASVSAYRHATGLEALFGYLFLTGEQKRIRELFLLCTEQNRDGEEK